MRATRRTRLAIATSAAVLAVVLASCSVSGGSTDTATNPFAPGRSGSTTSTTEGKGSDKTPVKPAEIPVGYQALNGEGVGVGLAVPTSWTPMTLTGDQLANGSKVLEKDNPELSALAGSAGAMLSDAKVLAARGTGTRGVRPVVAIIQTDLSLPTVPKMMGDQVEQQFKSAGATDVSTSMIPIHGLDGEARALEVSVTLAMAGQSVQLHEVIVPSSLVLVIIAMTGPPKTVDTIVSTIAAV